MKMVMTVRIPFKHARSRLREGSTFTLPDRRDCG